MFRVEFETDNADFEDSGPDAIRHFMEQVVLGVACGERAGKLRDRNGNTVGRWEWA